MNIKSNYYIFIFYLQTFTVKKLSVIKVSHVNDDFYQLLSLLTQTTSLENKNFLIMLLFWFQKNHHLKIVWYNISVNTRKWKSINDNY
jgi:hypothetical protein